MYESLMGYHVLRVTSPAVRLGSNHVWAETEAVRATKPTDRKRFWKEICGLSKTAQEKAEAALKGAADTTELAEQLAELSSGAKAEKSRHRAGPGRLVLQPGEERRRTGSHYTPRWLSEKVVQRTLEPILACLGEDRTPEQILSLKICDPAMGSGAFLVAACRLLAKDVADAWQRSGEAAAIIEQYGDAELHAMRLVAQRCLYGVDKNAAAVELAKLSLWLVTLSKELPFTFVDHALRHGDSLVGLDLDQIKSFHWQPKQQLETCRRALDDALEQALEHRDLILELATKEDPVSQREKTRLLEYAEQATARIRMIADVCVGAFFAEDRPKAREKERDRRLDLVRRLLDGDDGVRDELEDLAGEIRRRHAPFHWMTEFPEVFYLERPDPLDGARANRAAYMDGFTGNPPFQTGTRISTFNGLAYRDWLAAHFDSSSIPDLCAYFFRRAIELLGANGTVGFVATSTISQGHTRKSGLARACELGGRIYEATTSMPWPGDASVSVSLVHLAKGNVPARRRWLNGQQVGKITSFLSSVGRDREPEQLVLNRDIAISGRRILGTGFLFDESNADANSPELLDHLLAKDPRNGQRVKSFLGGEDLNTSPDQSSTRHIIDFGEMEQHEAEQWPDLFSIVEQKVKPFRQHVKQADRRRLWWLHATRAPRRTSFLREHERTLAISLLGKHYAFAFVGRDVVIGNTVVVILLDGCHS